MQVTIINADDRCSEPSCNFQVFRSVNFDDRVHAKTVGRAEQMPELRFIEGRDDQQNGVGTESGGLIDLIPVNDEVLSQQRQVDGRPGDRQVVERTAKILRFGQHRDRGGTAALIREGGFADVDPVIDDAL